jgi:hypothetical protein
MLPTISWVVPGEVSAVIPSGATLHTLRDEFVAAVPWGAAYLGGLARDSFGLTHLRRVGSERPVWMLRAAPPTNLQESFGLAPEVLFLAITGEVQAQDLQRAQDEVQRSGLRLDGNLVVVTDQRPETLSARLNRIPGRGQRVPWVPARGASLAAGVVFPALDASFRAALPRYDVFEERDAVRGPQLLGRDEELAALRTRVVRGDAAVVLGLRKVGKSSLVRAVTDWLDPASGMADALDGGPPPQGVALWVDAEGILEDSADALAEELLGALRRRMRVAGTPWREPSVRGLAALKSALELLLNNGERLCLVVDEYDLLFEGNETRRPLRGLSRFFRLVRAWAQTHQGRVSLVLLGRDPELFSTPLLDGVNNPLLAWCSPFWLGPLREGQDRQLLRRLGRRVGLQVGNPTVERAREWSAGHPLLLRQYGSALWGLAQSRGWGVDTDTLLASADLRFEGREAVETVARETTTLLRDRYPDAFRLLEDLALGGLQPGTLAAHGGEEGAAWRRLRNFGVVGEGGQVPRFLARHLARNATTVRRVG